MIGVESFLSEIMSLLIPLAVIGIGIGARVKQGRSSKALYFIGFGVVFLLLTGIRFFHEASNQHFLRNLAVGDVSSITVGDVTLTEQEEFSAIINSLNDCRWFSSDHGGWADTVDLIVKLKNGEVRRYRIAYYLREHGVVIEFFRAHKYSEWEDGYAFSSSLPEALADAGIRLPEQL